MAAHDPYSLCLLGFIDRLWFHQIILFSSSEPFTVLNPNHKTLKQNIPLVTSSLINFPSNLSLATQEEEEEEISSESSSLSLDHQLKNRENDQENKEEERQTRLNLVTATSRARSQSSSPLMKKNNNRNSKSNYIRKLKKSKRCRSLGELELEEVKGFMDLGFIFKKEYKAPNNNQENQEEEEEGGGEEKEIIRPYLSEAWLIKRPDSPLLNLKLPRVYAAAVMKKHLKFWARTVATVIQQES